MAGPDAGKETFLGLSLIPWDWGWGWMSNYSHFGGPEDQD